MVDRRDKIHSCAQKVRRDESCGRVGLSVADSGEKAELTDSRGEQATSTPARR